MNYLNSANSGLAGRFSGHSEIEAIVDMEDFLSSIQFDKRTDIVNSKRGDGLE